MSEFKRNERREMPNLAALPRDVQLMIQTRTAQYHYRNGAKNKDGSLGIINIGLFDLQEEIAAAMLFGISIADRVIMEEDEQTPISE